MRLIFKITSFKYFPSLLMLCKRRTGSLFIIPPSSRFSDIFSETHLQFSHILRTLFINRANQKSQEDVGGQGSKDSEIIFLKFLSSETAYTSEQYDAMLHLANTMFLQAYSLCRSVAVQGFGCSATCRDSSVTLTMA